MNRIENAFKNGKAFIGFLTAGDPSLDKTEEFIIEMAQAGADLIEIGIPFSDPIAEGVVIQEADLRALASGTTIDKIFEMVCNVRTKIDIPLVFMTYANPVYKYGYDEFFEKCKKIGIDGIIIPDIPFEEKKEADSIASKYDIDVISMIAPTSEQRIGMISSEAKGFIYLVSSLGVTGVRSEIKTDLDSIIEVIRKNTKTKVCVGFGISTPEQASKISKSADGIIVGSAIVKIIEKYGDDSAKYLYEYVNKMKSAI